MGNCAMNSAIIDIMFLFFVLAIDMLCFIAGALLGATKLHKAITGMMLMFEHPKLRKHQPYLEG